MKLYLLLTILVLLAGCGMTNDHFDIYHPTNKLITSAAPAPIIHCQSISDTHFFTSVAGLICWNDAGQTVTPANSAVMATTPANLVGTTTQALTAAAGEVFAPKPTTHVTTTVTGK